MIGRLRELISTRVSRRLFVVFVLSAFLPLAAIALLSFSQVRSMLLQQGDQRLAAVAKSYGMTLFERLLLAAEVGVASASSLQGAVPADSLVHRTFQWLGVMDSEGKWRTVLGRHDSPPLSDGMRERLVQGKPVTLVIGANGDYRVVIVSPLSAPSGGFIAGELKPEFLWGPGDELPASTQFCVVEEGSGRVLKCSQPSEQVAAIAMADRASGAAIQSTEWEHNGETYRGRSWPQFMRAGFGTSDWLIMASQPESYQLARVKEFRRIYIPVVGLALLLVIWLTMRQSRDIVGPVERLAERARGIARNDFQTKLNIKRKDEFGELANAFDHMSHRLGRQFASLTALAEIDRLILSTQDTSQVIRTVLQRLDDVVPTDLVTITLFDHDNPAHARTYFRPPDSPSSVSMLRHEVSAVDRSTLDMPERDSWVDITPDIALPGFLAQVQTLGMKSAFVQPIVWRGTVCGALVLGYRAEGNVDFEERQRAQELADRVAVAVSSAWRDEQLYVQAHFDTLTGLPNRLLFKDRVGREIARSQRENLQFALLFVDLDHFKNVNDSFGHTIGDGVLREAARRITRCIRDSDTVSRLGGDEFTVLLTSLHHPQEAWLIAETMVASLSQEFSIGDQQCFLSASIGIASFPVDGQSVEELLKSADTAMYRAKASGRSQAVFFEEKMNAETVQRLTLDRDLRLAIDRNELVLHYQPQVDLRTGSVKGAEALVRWHHATQGIISPSRFIALAEESGFIDQIGQWTIQQACQQMKIWRAEGLPIDRIAVNVSPRQFRRRTLVEFFRQSVADAGLPSSCIEIEITEGLLLDRGESVEGMLRDLASDGHGIALDDFGTGFSSMSYLKRFPVDIIKIDRVFIDGMERSSDSEAIVSAIIAMSHALGKTVIAEGVETLEQRALLRKLRCDEIQGFLISPAVPPGDFAALVRNMSQAEMAEAS